MRPKVTAAAAAWLVLLATSAPFQSAAAAAPPREVQRLSVREAFGVSHPEQVIDFDLSQPIDAASTSLLDAGGKDVPYQLLRGNRIAVRTDLPAGVTRTWTLVAGKAPAPISGGVKVTKT